MRCLLVSSLLFGCAWAFMEDILRQMGGGGGGQQFHFNMGGHQQQQHEFPGWPKGLSGNIHANFDFMKGTVWNWNNWRHVTFEHDGNFKAPTEECENGACKWSAGKKKLYIMWGREAGLHVMEPTSFTLEKGVRLNGVRRKDRHKAFAEFLQVDEDAAALHKDLYKVLGLDPQTADEGEIKKSYRKLSIMYHPDKNKNDPQAIRKFNEIREANEILADPDKKFLYDTAGLKAVKDAEKEDAANNGQQGHDPFAAFFGGQQRAPQEKRKAKKGATAQMDVSIPLDTMYNGGSFQATIPSRRVVCLHCRNSNEGKCAGCKACPAQTRMVQRQMGNMIVQQQENIPSKDKCKQEDGVLTLEIEQGIEAGHKLTFHRMHEQTPGEIPGDVVVTVKQNAHKIYTRKGNDLYREFTISMKEALLGFERKFMHMDNREVVLTRTGVTQPDTVHKLGGEGMPLHQMHSDHGDMYVTLKVELPSQLSDEQKAKLQQVL